MSLRSVTLIVALLTTLAVALSAVNFADVLLDDSATIATVSLASWATGMVADIAIASFFWVLYAKQRGSR